MSAMPFPCNGLMLYLFSNYPVEICNTQMRVVTVFTKHKLVSPVTNTLPKILVIHLHLYCLDWPWFADVWYLPLQWARVQVAELYPRSRRPPTFQWPPSSETVHEQVFLFLSDLKKLGTGPKAWKRRGCKCWHHHQTPVKVNSIQLESQYSNRSIYMPSNPGPPSDQEYIK